MRLALAPFLLAPLLFADDPPPKPSDGVTLVAEKSITADLGRKCIVDVKTSAKKVTFQVPAEVDFITLDGKRIACWALPGSYTIRAMVPSGDDVISTEIVLTVTGARPPPPPVDQLVKDLQAAYDADTSATKRKDIADLTEVMAGCVATAKKGGKVKVTKDLQDGVHSVTGLVIQDRLMGVRTAIGGYMAPKLGTASKPVDEAFWTLAAAEYGAVATALGKVVK